MSLSISTTTTTASWLVSCSCFTFVVAMRMLSHKNNVPQTIVKYLKKYFFKVITKYLAGMCVCDGKPTCGFDEEEFFVRKQLNYQTSQLGISRAQ